MPARLAYSVIYREIVRNLDEDGRLRVDELLKDPTAGERLNERRMELIALSGGEIG